MQSVNTNENELCAELKYSLKMLGTFGNFSWLCCATSWGNLILILNFFWFLYLLSLWISISFAFCIPHYILFSRFAEYLQTERSNASYISLITFCAILLSILSQKLCKCKCERMERRDRGRRECRATVCARFANCLAEQVKSAPDAVEWRLKRDRVESTPNLLSVVSVLSEWESVVGFIWKEGSGGKEEGA